MGNETAASTNVFFGGLPNTNVNLLSDEVTTETKVGSLDPKAKFSIGTIIGVAVLFLALCSLLNDLRGR